VADRRIRRIRIAADMAECGVVRSDDVCFGRPYVKDVGVPVGVIWDRFCSGESLAFIAHDHGMAPRAAENAVRFVARNLTCDLPSFWEGTGL
jgi:uncharacterized protein (DUF433 family)